MATLPRPSTPKTAVIGRAHEKARLAELLDIGSTAKRAAVLIGEPGVGKTTLLRWAYEQAVELNRLTAFVRVPSAAGLPPRFPIGELLEGLSDSCERLRIPVPDPLRRVLDTLRGTTSADEYPAALPQIASALEVAAERAPLALFIDDYHAVAPETAALLVSALRVAEAPAVLLMSARESSTPSSPGVLEPSADLWIEQLQLISMPASDTEQIAIASLGGPVLPSLAAALHSRCSGNPLFAVETLHEWRSRGHIQQTDGFWMFTDGDPPTVSPSLEVLLRERICRVAPAAKQAMLAIALMARDFTMAELAEVLSLDIDAAVGIVDQLETHGFVNVSGHRVALQHPAHSSSIVESHTKTQRARTHQTIYEMLRTRNGPPTELAHHAVRSTQLPLDVEDLIARAADYAESRGAYEEAAGWYQRLVDNKAESASRKAAAEGLARVTTYTAPDLAILRFSSALEESTTSSAKIDLLLGRAEALRVSGRFGEALEDLLMAQSLTTQPVFGVAHRVAVLRALSGDVAGALVELRRLESSAPSADDRFAVKGHIGQAQFVTGDLSGAFTTWLEVLASSTRPRDRDYVRANAAWAAVLLGEWQAAKGLLEDALATAVAVGDFWSLQSLHSSAVKFAAWQGNAASAMDHALAARRLAHRLENPVAMIEAAESRGIALIAAERTLEAIPHLEHALELGMASMEVREPVITLCYLGEALLECEGPASVKSVLAKAEEALGSMHFYRPMVDLLSRSVALASGNLRHAASAADDEEAMPFLQGKMAFVNARASAALGRWADAEAHAAKAEASLLDFGLVPQARRVTQWWEQAQPKLRGRPRSKLPAGVTERERDALIHLSQGLSIQEVANEMFLSAETVRKYVQSMRRKLGAPNRRVLFAEAQRVGLLD